MPDNDLDSLARQIGGSDQFQRALAKILEKSSPLKGVLRRLATAAAHDVSLGNVPGFGSGQVDSYTARDNVDVGFPMRVNYLIPSLVQRVTTAKLSWKLMAYRTYSSISLNSTGTESAGHVHGTGGETGHSHNHGHSWHIASSAGTATMRSDGAGGVLDNTYSASDVGTTTNANGSSGHNHGNSGGESATHTHSVSGTTTLGIATGTTATGLTIQFDGVDQTAALGGPWSTDVVELDVTQFLVSSPTAAWHAITLTSLTQGQLETHLKISLYGNAGGLQ